MVLVPAAMVQQPPPVVFTPAAPAQVAMEEGRPQQYVRPSTGRLTLTNPAMGAAKMRQSVTEAYNEAVEERKKIKFRRRPIWTGCLCIAWLMVAGVCLLTHAAVNKIVPPIGNLPSNVLKGFKQEFNFADLSRDGEIVKNNAELAMETCAPIPVDPTDPTKKLCDNKVFAQLDISKSTTSDMLKEINKAFERSLSMILNITTDKCLKAQGFNETAVNLQKVLNNTRELGSQVTDAYCQGSWPLYCGIQKAGQALVTGATEVDKQIDAMAASDSVKKLEENKSYLEYLHGLPYILVMSLVFFTLFWWWSGGVCCCCKGGNCIGCCCCLIPHLVLWWFYFALAALFVAMGLLIPMWAEDTKVAFDGAGCTVAGMMEHIETTYSGFYDVVFKDLIEGCLMFVQAFRAALGMCLFIGSYALCICICRPYNREATYKGVGGEKKKLTETE